MSEANPIRRARFPWRGAALAMSAVAALGWWRQARRDAELVARTRARLTFDGRAPVAASERLPGAQPPSPGRAGAGQPYSPDLTGLKVG